MIDPNINPFETNDQDDQEPTEETTIIVNESWINVTTTTTDQEGTTYVTEFIPND